MLHAVTAVFVHDKWDHLGLNTSDALNTEAHGRRRGELQSQSAKSRATLGTQHLVLTLTCLAFINEVEMVHFINFSFKVVFQNFGACSVVSGQCSCLS